MAFLRNNLIIIILSMLVISGCSKGNPKLEVSPKELDFGETLTENEIT